MKQILMLVFFHLGEEESNFEQILWKEASCIVAKPLPRPLSVRFAKHSKFGVSCDGSTKVT